MKFYQHNCTHYLLLFIVLISCNFSRAQPAVGHIDFYGLKKISPTTLENAMGIQPGNSLIKTDKQLEEMLQKVPGVKRASISRICCEEGKSILFVGIKEDSVKDYPWKVLPVRNLTLPAGLTEKYNQYMATLAEAVNKGDTGDDVSAGHSLLQNAKTKEIQLSFIPMADKYFAQLSDVLQHSSLEQQREAAATIICYASNKQKVADQLYLAMTDPSPTVRNNIFRNIAAISAYTSKHPEIKFKVRIDLYIWMLQSIHWTDRNKALFSLLGLTEYENKELFASLKRNSLPELIEMANWKSKQHAFLSYIVLGRLARIPGAEIFSSWGENRKDIVFRHFQ